MSRTRDAWYIRLPTGQEIKAKSTAAVVHHVENGTIPKASLARRARDGEWMQLEWHAEFTEAVTGKPPPKGFSEDKPAPPEKPPSVVLSRLDPMRLRTVGIRGLLDDLAAALDSTFSRDKIFVAAVAAGLIGLIWGLVPWLFGLVVSEAEIKLSESELAWAGRALRVASAFASLVILAWANGLLAQMTHLELALMRAVSWRTALHGFSGHGARLATGYLLILGGGFVLISFLHWVPNVALGQLLEAGVPNGIAQVVPILLSVVGVVVEVLFWLIAGLMWLLAPAMVGENYLLGPGLREWYRLVRAHFGRVVLAEMLTLAVGLLLAAPIYLPIEYALGRYGVISLPLRTMGYGLALTGLLAFMAVANVFVYLDVKYEHAEQ